MAFITVVMEEMPKKGCSHQHVAKICKSEIRWSKDRMTHTWKVQGTRGMRHGYIAWGEWHKVVAKSTTVFIDHPLPNVQTFGHEFFIFLPSGYFYFFHLFNPLLTCQCTRMRDQYYRSADWDLFHPTPLCWYDRSVLEEHVFTCYRGELVISW